MKRLILLFSVILAVSAYCGNKTLKDKTYIYWDDSTETIQYNSYRVYVKMTDTSNQNVFGGVYLYDTNGKCVGDKNLFIPAGEMSGYVDFEGLSNGIRYRIKVKINNE